MLKESFYATELYHSTSFAVNIIFKFQTGNNFKCVDWADGEQWRNKKILPYVTNSTWNYATTVLSSMSDLKMRIQLLQFPASFPPHQFLLL